MSEEAVPEDSRSDTPMAVLVLMICQPMRRARFWETEIWCWDTYNRTLQVTDLVLKCIQDDTDTCTVLGHL